MALTLEMLHHGRRVTDIGDCLKMVRYFEDLTARMFWMQFKTPFLSQEYRLVRRCMEAPDFYEGVRALLVDKDNKPIWKPARVEDILPISTAKYFTRLADPADEISFDHH